ncbi:MAG: precorrin-6A/cobalt-precorrin-6A reductase, partial [Planctomycetota bacterium]
MILLLGGTSETAPLATRLADAGYGVLVSTATETPLETGRHPRIRRRCGRLDAEALAALAVEIDASALVDAAHPYAEALHRNATLAADATGLPLFP